MQNVLSNFNVNTNNLIIFRVNKVLPNKHRLIKVILQSKYNVVLILKNVKSDRNVITQGKTIISDQTKQQKEHYMKIKRQLKELITQGEGSKPLYTTKHQYYNMETLKALLLIKMM